VAFFVDEGYVAFFARFGGREVAVGEGRGGCEEPERWLNFARSGPRFPGLVMRLIMDNRIPVEPPLPLWS
jgi:hypothetical protein